MTNIICSVSPSFHGLYIVLIFLNMPRFFTFLDSHREPLALESIHVAVANLVRAERGAPLLSETSQLTPKDETYTTLIDVLAIVHGGRTASAVATDLRASPSVHDQHTARVLDHLVNTCALHAFGSGCCK
jgi:hypothetical protein